MKKFLLSLLVSVVSLSAMAGWVKTDLASIKATDVVVIVDEKGNYAMSNNNGTSKAPAGVILTIANNKITSEVADNLKWNIVADGSNYTIYPNGTTETWLYCTNTNNGVRVGTNENKVFTFESTHLKNTATSRYLGVYTTTPDWRCYTSSTTANIKETVTGFYVYIEGDDSGEEPGDDPVVPENPTEGYTYQLVTSDSELEANEKYIIVATEYNYAMSTTQNSNNRGQNGITKNENKITFSNEDIDNVQVLTLEEGAIANTWALFTGEKYLYAASSSGNQLKELTTKNENTSATISISGSGVASIVFQGEYTRNTLRYNTSSGLFACYAPSNTQKDVSLYKYIDTTTGIEDTMVDENAPVEYYNLQGVKIANPENGIFIKKQGNKTTKVVL